MTKIHFLVLVGVVRNTKTVVEKNKTERKR